MMPTETFAYCKGSAEKGKVLQEGDMRFAFGKIIPEIQFVYESAACILKGVS